MSDVVRRAGADPEWSPDWVQVFGRMAAAADAMATSTRRMATAAEEMSAGAHQFRRRTHRPSPPPTRKVTSERLDR